MIKSEIDILTKVQHPNVISLYRMFESEQKIFLVMQLVTGGELFDRILARGHYTEADAARIVHPILSAVEYLHEMGIAHRDLKPENLLFSDRSENARIMISDFGLSKIFDDVEMMKTACGTPGYVGGLDSGIRARARAAASGAGWDAG
ncbi:MAG: kinase-like domain-containing protein, partial [Olpidium bornovanus]